MRRILAGAVAVAMACTLAAGAAGATTHHHKKAKPKPKAQPWIGSTLLVLNETKQYEAVKLEAITDPAQGADEFTTPDPGKRFVGVTFEITNRGPGADSNDANDNATVVGSDKQDYTPDLNSLAGCTDFAYGQYNLGVHAQAVGCVAFQLPTGVTVAKVQWNPNAGFSTNEATWTAPKAPSAPPTS
jgi:hypothetical protein